MNKQLIGVLRVIVALVLMYSFDVSFDPYDLKLWISDLIHGAHTPELRNSDSVAMAMIPFALVAGFFIIQTILYITVPALQSRNTSIFNFTKHSFVAIIENLRDPHFWASSSESGNLDRVNEVLSYRDNKMAMMNNSQAVDFMRGTGHVDMLLSRPDLKQSRKALSYMNNKMSMMSNEQALNFMKGQ